MEEFEAKENKEDKGHPVIIVLILAGTLTLPAILAWCLNSTGNSQPSASFVGEPAEMREIDGH